jgi:signal transduction histidine kinase
MACPYGSSRSNSVPSEYVWKTGVAPACAATASVMQRQHPASTADPQELQQAFYCSLLDYLPKEPQADLQHICQAWQCVSNAQWVWLWLYDANSGCFELSAGVTREGAAEHAGSILPKERQAPGRKSIGTYCSIKREPVFVDDIKNWRSELQGVKYRIDTAESLEALGCAGFDCVPLLIPDGGERTGSLKTAGVVTLHWRDLSQRIGHGEAAFTNMARLSALCIRDSRMTEQRTILVQLNRMAQKFVTRPSRHPSDVRSEYLKDLIHLIKAHIHVGQVSVFYATQFSDAVECIATTGLIDARGNEVPDNRLRDAAYKAYEGLTGCCYASNKPIFVQRPASDGRSLGTYREKREIEPSPGQDDPCCLTPIPPPPTEDVERQRALGVIRCIERRSLMWPGEICHFEPNALQTLGFIAEQVGPVLRMFDQRIARERSVSVVKHDLAAPLGMILDSVHGVIEAQANGVPLGDYDLENIQACAFLAQNLARQLDPMPGDIAHLNFEPTMLEGGIIARLCKMLRRFARLNNGVELLYEGLRTIPRLLIDRAHVERAVFNLLLNAIKYSKRGGTVRIIGRRSESGFWVDVSDEGLGVSEADSERIFEPGFRSAEAARMAQGLGLGLALARQIMKAHRGDVVLTSKRNPTTFSLFFPRDAECSN